MNIYMRKNKLILQVKSFNQLMIKIIIFKKVVIIYLKITMKKMK